MADKAFGIEDLTRTLREAAGAPEGIDLNDDILDVEFDEMGYDSLALQETGSRIERAYGIQLEESVVVDARTPRELLTTVNTRLSNS
jgi:act minimal PKS acyl carrier protein